MIGRCKHEAWDMDGALADGYCPLCLHAEVIESRAVIEKLTTEKSVKSVSRELARLILRWHDARTNVLVTQPRSHPSAAPQLCLHETATYRAEAEARRAAVDAAKKILENEL